MQVGAGQAGGHHTGCTRLAPTMQAGQGTKCRGLPACARLESSLAGADGLCPFSGANPPQFSILAPKTGHNMPGAHCGRHKGKVEQDVVTQVVSRGAIPRIARISHQ
jgi:hypothetical protein